MVRLFHVQCIAATGSFLRLRAVRGVRLPRRGRRVWVAGALTTERGSGREGAPAARIPIPALSGGLRQGPQWGWELPSPRGPGHGPAPALSPSPFQGVGLGVWGGYTPCRNKDVTPKQLQMHDFLKHLCFLVFKEPFNKGVRMLAELISVSNTRAASLKPENMLVL